MLGPQLSSRYVGRQPCTNQSTQLARLAAVHGVGAAQALTRKVVAPHAYQPHNASFDSSDELDKDLADELTAVADPNKFQRMKQHLDLLWKVTKVKAPAQVCNCCRGSGEKECDWCHGTGFMTIGDKVYLSHDASKCPVCKAKGYVKCEFCRGTGSIAHWLKPSAEGGAGAPRSTS